VPINVQVHIWPKEIGAGVNERGNVEIVGMDAAEGTIVKIEVGSQEWPHVYKQLGRLTGVGIYKANRAPIEVVQDLPKENGS
jgi:hypothetical protein